MKYIVTIREKYEEEVEAKTVADAEALAERNLFIKRKSRTAIPADIRISTKRIREKIVHVSSNQKKKAERALKESIK